VYAGTHPDLHLVTREEDRRDIRIEQVRELTRWLALQPLAAPRKVAIIDGAHQLNDHAQNALLKTLEEPPATAVLLLTATSRSLLLPTVRSRCRLIRVDPLPVEDVIGALVARGLSPEQAGALAPLAGGCPGRALALAATDATRIRARMLEQLPQLGALDAFAISQLAQELARDAVDTALATAVSWYRDVLGAALVGDTSLLHNRDAQVAVREAAARWPATARLRQLEVVCDTLSALERNANRMLALETMLLCLRQIERRGTRSQATDPSWTSPR
jgi:DNA polymerase-3 subunit delta'